MRYVTYFSLYPLFERRRLFNLYEIGASRSSMQDSVKKRVISPLILLFEFGSL